MNSPINEIGYFKRLNDDRQVYGQWSCNESEGSKLDLCPPLIKDQEESQKQIDLIHGFTVGGKEMTFISNVESYYRPIPGLLHSEISSREVFIGHQFESINDIKFDKVVVEIDGLLEWINTIGFKKTIENRAYINSYKIEDPIELYECPDYKIRLIFRGYRPKRNINKAEIIRTTHIELTWKKEKKKVDENLKILSKIKDLISFSLNKELNFYNIILQNSEILGSHDIIKDIDYIFGYGQNEIVPSRNKHLFKLDDTNISPIELISNWLELHDKVGSFIELYFMAIFHYKLYSETRFRNLIFCLEAYHERVFPNTKMNDSQYKAKIKKIKEKLTKQEKELVSEILGYGNKINLRERLNIIINQIDFLKKILDKKRENTMHHFIDKIVQTRNYMVHHEKRLEIKPEKLVSHEEFYKYNAYLKMMLQYLILNGIGFLDEFIESTLMEDFINQHVISQNIE